ncbi:MAG: DNA-binding protein [Planctomycetota bacterium]|nr:MAG: DNA-binding protein [Planctomycetota bacterium]REK29713.1 MAG: DNA-binding protein [Planctomycetota bacterium]REK30466.1 MAG: DNA-binding protein [Planctomycetota bacterium]
MKETQLREAVPPPPPPPPKVNRQGAADYVGASYATMCSWATKGGGPPFIKVGAKVWYLISDLDEWIASRRVRCASEIDD